MRFGGNFAVIFRGQPIVAGVQTRVGGVGGEGTIIMGIDNCDRL